MSVYNVMLFYYSIFYYYFFYVIQLSHNISTPIQRCCF